MPNEENASPSENQFRSLKLLDIQADELPEYPIYRPDNMVTASSRDWSL